MRHIIGILKLIKDAIWKFFDDDAFTHAGAVAFFTALSLAPLVVILIGVTSWIGEGFHEKLVAEISSLAGSTTGEAVDMVLRHTAERPTAGSISAILGLLTLLFSATGVFVQLQKAMNQIWGIQPEPGREIRDFFHKRIVSLGMILGIGFLLLVSLAISAVLSAFVAGEGWVWQGVNLLASLIVYVIAFGAILQYIPDADIRWGDVAVGALITAVLFNAGKFLIGEYLGTTTVASAYGAAGSLVLLLVWVYYSSLIIFFGSELAVLYTERYGAGIVPDRHARWIDPERRRRTDRREVQWRRREEARQSEEGR